MFFNFVIAQKSSTIFSKYETSFSDFFNFTLSNDNYNTHFVKTDTVGGFEIHYYFFDNGDFNKCNKLIFFTQDTTILYTKNLFVYFNENPMSFVNFSMLNSLDASLYTNSIDTFYYKNDNVAYNKENFFKFLEQEQNKSKFYKVSNNEYIKIAKVRVIVDVFSGDDTLKSFFFPVLYKDYSVSFLQLHYRETLSRQYIYPAKFLNKSPFEYEKFNRCSYIYD